MKTKHTPGPWMACKPEDALHAVRRPSDHNLLGMIICDVGYGETVDVNVANARLIAAAPDLLGALQKVMAHNVPLTGNPTHAQQVEFWQDEKEQGRGDADDMLTALAAIAKATGESL